MRKRILVIVNPTAGSSRARRLRRIIDRLEQHGCTIRLHETRARGDARGIAGAADYGDIDAVVVAGGDGTINEVLNGLPIDGPPLAILPFGTANVLAREIGLSHSPIDLADTILFGRSHSITIGEVNGRRFIMMASVGLDAQVVEHVDLALKRVVGKWAYVVEMLRQTMTAMPVTYRLCMDKTEQAASGIVIANGRHYAGRYITSPDANLEKPSLDVCCLTRSGRSATLSYLLSLLLGRFARNAGVHIGEATDLEILGPVGAPLQADGDILCRLPATIRVLPRAVQLIYPGSVGRPGWSHLRTRE